MSGPVTDRDEPSDRRGRRLLRGAGGDRSEGVAGGIAHRAAGAAAPRPTNGGAVVLRRRDGPGARRRRRRHRPPPAHRPADGHLAPPGRAPAPGQPRQRAADPPGPAEPHERRPWRVARRGVDRAQGRCTGSSFGSPSPRQPATAPPPSSTTLSFRVRSCRGAEVSVLVGELAGARSSARCDTRHVGAELRARGAVEVPLDASFEHAVLVVHGDLSIDGQPVPTGHLAYLPPGRSALDLRAPEPAVALLLGGGPVPGRAGHVVELRGPHARRGARGPRGMDGPGRTVRHSALCPGAGRRRPAAVVDKVSRPVEEPSGTVASPQPSARSSIGESI